METNELAYFVYFWVSVYKLDFVKLFWSKLNLNYKVMM
jgi:hypothetical protein